MSRTEFELFFQVMVEDSIWLDSFDKISRLHVRANCIGSKSESKECLDSSQADCSAAKVHSTPCQSVTAQHELIWSTSHAIQTYGLLKRACMEETNLYVRNMKPCTSKSENFAPSRGGAISIDKLLN